MGEIKNFDLTRLRNQEHAQFHTDVNAEIKSAGEENLGIAKLMPDYKTALEAEHAAIDVENGSQHTATVEEMDADRDEIVRSLTYYVKSKKLSYIPEERQAATLIYRIIKQAGNIRRKNYNEESDAIRSLVTQITTNYPKEMEAIKIVDILGELTKSNDAFSKIFNTRAGEISVRPEGDVRVTRTATDKAYQSVVKAINGLAILDDTGKYTAVIDKINYLVDYYRNTLFTRQGVADAKEKKAEETNTSDKQ